MLAHGPCLAISFLASSRRGTAVLKAQLSTSAPLLCGFGAKLTRTVPWYRTIISYVIEERSGTIAWIPKTSYSRYEK